MDKDWIKAVTLLCIIAQNNADSMKRSVRYAEIMKKEYGLDAEKFQPVFYTLQMFSFFSILSIKSLRLTLAFWICSIGVFLVFFTKPFVNIIFLS